MKYEITDEAIEYNGHTLHRIKAIKTFWTSNMTEVHEGELGGYIESESNLSQEHLCWIFYPAKVYENAVIEESAMISGQSDIYGSVIISNMARVEDSKIFDHARINGASMVINNSTIFDYVETLGECTIDNSVICGDIIITDMVRVSNSYLSSNSKSPLRFDGESSICNANMLSLF